MTGDFSTRYEVADDNFNGVLYQQGRVFLDTDGNAQTRITSLWQDTAGQDIIGAGVLAVPMDAAGSFQVTNADVIAGQVQLTINPGHAWADGMLVRLDETPPIHRIATYLGPPVQNPQAVLNTAAGTRDAVVLEVWREAINGFQIPNELIEPALGGPDTTERVHTAYDFRLLRLAPGDDCDNLADKLSDNFPNKGRLTVTLRPPVIIPGDCPVVEGGGYTGFEHNLYRIEMAETGGGAVRFKWSQFNGGLVGRGIFDAATLRATITANLQAIITSGLSSFYLETREYDAALGRWRVTYGATVTLNNNNELVLPAAATFGAIPAPNTAVFFRLWNELRPITDFPVQANPNHLRDGIFLQFEANAVGKYVPEDYWTFSVRAGEISNPQTLINNSPPDGIHYHRVSLAILEWNGTPNLSAAAGTIDDCRWPFPPLTRLSTCCTFRVGDGIISHGHFKTIQEAVDHLPASGGEVCVLPGTYVENVRIENRINVTISGCGRRTRVVSRPPIGNLAADPVFHVRNCRGVVLEHMEVEAHETGRGIFLQGTNGLVPGGGINVSNPLIQRFITIKHLFLIAARRSAVECRNSAEVMIRDCIIEMRDVSSSWPAIFFMGEDGWIERNVIRVRPREGPSSEGLVMTAAAGLGGIQIAGTSERVHILENLIQSGIGNGITLGSVILIGPNGEDDDDVGWPINPNDPCFPCLPGDGHFPDPDIPPGRPRPRSAGPLYDIYIERNRILDMGLNGIGVAAFFNLRAFDEMIIVVRLTIHENEIRRCLKRPLAVIPDIMMDAMGYGGISLADVEYLVIRENIIEDNGPNHLEPICGIFILHGEGVDISLNRILNNGAKNSEPPTAAKDGRRGGINIVYCIAPTVTITVLRVRGPEQNGVPALKVHDNIVSVPLGQALCATALGPVSVHANQFTSRGLVLRTRPLSPGFIASTVMIFNLGLSNEFYLQYLAFAAIANGQGGGGLAAPPNDVAVLPGLDDLRVGRYLANGNVLFTDNQVTLDLLETGANFSVSSVLIFSLDDVGFHSNQCECSLLDDFVLTNVMLFAFSVRASDNRFKEGIFNAFLSGITLGFMNMTTDNQATHCLVIRGWTGFVVNNPNTILSAGGGRYCERFGNVLGDFGILPGG